jgi:hypothetical protein
MLGDFEAQIRSAKEALRFERDLPGSYRQVLARYHLAVGLALSGNRFESLNAAKALASRPIETASLWVQQAFHLFLADAFWLAGKRPLAMRQARIAVSGRFDSPLATGFTGMHARWLARVDAEASTTRRHLEALLTGLQDLDVIDRVDIGLAMLLVYRETSAEYSMALARTMELLDSLPGAVAHFFSELGLMPKSPIRPARLRNRPRSELKQ